MRRGTPWFKAFKNGLLVILIYVAITVIAIIASSWEGGAALILWDGLQYPAAALSEFLDRYVPGLEVPRGHEELVHKIFRYGIIWFAYALIGSRIAYAVKNRIASRQGKTAGGKAGEQQ